MTDKTLPVGKLRAELLAQLLSRAPVEDPRILVGPGLGMDCAVLDMGDVLLVCKSDPITFATEELGHYLVQINLNDLATTGAEPRWLLVTLLLPEAHTTKALANLIMDQVYAACRELAISVIGGHTEITYGLDRPIAVGMLIGEVAKEELITPRGANPGDHVLLTKGVPVEATSILAREFPERLRQALTESEIERARRFLFEPGISVFRDARIAMAAGRVSAMHDPTEGGLLTALWELAWASGKSITVDPSLVPVPPLSARICKLFGIKPLAAMASGSLILTASARNARAIRAALDEAGIPCTRIGEVGKGPATVWELSQGRKQALPYPERDELAQVFED